MEGEPGNQRAEAFGATTGHAGTADIGMRWQPARGAPICNRKKVRSCPQSVSDRGALWAAVSIVLSIEPRKGGRGVGRACRGLHVDPKPCLDLRADDVQFKLVFLVEPKKQIPANAFVDGDVPADLIIAVDGLGWRIELDSARIVGRRSRLVDAIPRPASLIIFARISIFCAKAGPEAAKSGMAPATAKSAIRPVNDMVIAPSGLVCYGFSLALKGWFFVILQ